MIQIKKTNKQKAQEKTTNCTKKISILVSWFPKDIYSLKVSVKNLKLPEEHYNYSDSQVNPVKA